MTAPRPDLKQPVQFLATGFGSGLAPWAPGTFGTLAALPLYILLGELPRSGYLLATLAIVLAGVWICGRAAEQLGVHDHPAIVWDEIAGFLVTMVAAPREWLWAGIGFGLFRLFDIWKPWPIDLLDRQVGGGLGIMLDDLLAGCYAALCLQGLVLLRIF